MKLDIRTSSLKPRRQTYANIARRFGEDRPATRYQEATLDLQATDNFHYRPLWDPEHELYDQSRTAVKMEDWYELKDPRQFYYATYNISRASMQHATQSNFAFVEKRNMLSSLKPEWTAKIEQYLIPMRHYEWGANMNNFYITDYAYGTAVTSAAAFSAADRLGMAQTLSNIGLALDEHSGRMLEASRKHWLEAEYWQATRQAVEDSFVIEDWFETFIAQNLALDGVFHPLVFGEIDAAGQAFGAAPVSMLCEFMSDWFTDNSRWVDAVVGRAIKESVDNKALIQGWFSKWRGRAIDAATPLALHVIGDEGVAAIRKVTQQLDERALRLGLEVA